MNPILIIEDDVDTRDSYVEFLEMNGFTVEVAATRADALRMVAVRLPSAILLDLTLADGDGRELFEHLSNDTRTRDIAIAAMTGHSLPPEERSRFARVFTKPVNLDQVVSWLHGLEGSSS